MQFKASLHLDIIKSKFILAISGLTLIISGCNTLNRQSIFKNPQNEIEVNKTPMGNVMNLLGQEDDDFSYIACGTGSTHTGGWSTFKKFGLALHSTAYTPPRKDFANGIVENIGIFDTTNLTVNRSKQNRIYYGQGYYKISKSNLELVFGKPDKIKIVDTVQYILYSQRQMSFAFDTASKQFIRLYITKKR